MIWLSRISTSFGCSPFRCDRVSRWWRAAPTDDPPRASMKDIGRTSGCGAVWVASGGRATAQTTILSGFREAPGAANPQSHEACWSSIRNGTYQRRARRRPLPYRSPNLIQTGIGRVVRALVGSGASVRDTQARNARRVECRPSHAGIGFSRLNRSGFDAASFCEEDAGHDEALPGRAARACGEDGARSS